MLRLIINVLLILFCIVPSCSYASSKGFFPEAIKDNMNEDLDFFLKELPKNRGQRVFVERVMKYPEYKKILLFIDMDFSKKKFKTLSRLQKPYLLIETLDILSVNLALGEVFSNYFFNILLVNSKENPETYMAILFHFCKKSDGFYAESFFEPLVDILEKDPESFFNSLHESESFYEICEILKTGDRRHLIDILHNIATTSIGGGLSSSADKMSGCLEEK